MVVRAAELVGNFTQKKAQLSHEKETFVSNFFDSSILSNLTPQEVMIQIEVFKVSVLFRDL